MVHAHQGIHHLYRRKRLSKHDYPSKDKRIRMFDNIMLFLPFVMIIMTGPQIWQIYSNQNAQGVSMLSWLTYAIVSIPWVIYGVIHKAKPIILTYTLFFFMDLSIVIGAIKYG